MLDNDTMSGGVPLKLDPPAVKVVAGKGQAFASGSVVRYIPDVAPITTDDVVTLEYATYPEGSPDRAVTGRITVTVKPLPTPTTPNQPPTARSFSASVTAGDTITDHRADQRHRPRRRPHLRRRHRRRRTASPSTSRLGRVTSLRRDDGQATRPTRAAPAPR